MLTNEPVKKLVFTLMLAKIKNLFDDNSMMERLPSDTENYLEANKYVVDLLIDKSLNLLDRAKIYDLSLLGSEYDGLESLEKSGTVDDDHLTTALLHVSALQAFVSCVNSAESPSEINTNHYIPIAFDVAKYKFATVQNQTQVRYASLQGLRNFSFNSAEQYVISYTDDTAVKYSLIVKLLDNNAVDIDYNFTPSSRHSYKALDTFLDEHGTNDIYKLFILGVSQDNDFQPKLYEFIQRIRADYSLAEADAIVSDFLSLTESAKKDIELKSQSNLSLPSFDKLLEFLSVLD